MDKRSFIRGFGIGVLFAAIILGISCMIRTSDSFVTSRAKELGMVYAEDAGEKKVLSKQPAKTPEGSSTATPEVTKKTTEATPKATESATKEKQEEAKVTQEPKETTTEKQKSSDKEGDMEKEKKRLEKEIREEEKRLTIDVGDWSSDVSRKLEGLGVIKSAKDFDSYLDRNGYSSSINAGTYEVSVDDTYAELARKITKK